jgi:hypothetical protein
MNNMEQQSREAQESSPSEQDREHVRAYLKEQAPDMWEHNMTERDRGHAVTLNYEKVKQLYEEQTGKKWEELEREERHERLQQFFVKGATSLRKNAPAGVDMSGQEVASISPERETDESVDDDGEKLEPHFVEPSQKGTEAGLGVEAGPGTTVFAEDVKRDSEVKPDQPDEAIPVRGLDTPEQKKLRGLVLEEYKDLLGSIPEGTKEHEDTVRGLMRQAEKRREKAAAKEARPRGFSQWAKDEKKQLNAESLREYESLAPSQK